MAAMSNGSMPEFLVDLENSEIDRIATLKSNVQKNNDDILVGITRNNNKSNNSSPEEIATLNKDTAACDSDVVAKNKAGTNRIFVVSNQELNYENETITENNTIKDKVSYFKDFTIEFGLFCNFCEAGAYN